MKKIAIAMMSIVVIGMSASLAEKNQKLCETGDATGCYELARMYASGNGVKQDQFKAKMFYEKSCKGNHMQACNNLAIKYHKGQGTKQDYAKAKSFYKKACDGGIGYSCHKLGVLNKHGY